MINEFHTTIYLHYYSLKPKACWINTSNNEHHPRMCSCSLVVKLKFLVAFSCWLFNKEVEDELFLCNFHYKNINLRDFINFCTNDKTPEQVQQHSFYQNNKDLIELASTGKDWHKDEQLILLKNYMLTSHLPLLFTLRALKLW